MAISAEKSIDDAVLDRILSGRLASQAPIRQDTLATELGVSKIPLREALARLERSGLVEMIPNRGYFVRSLSRSEAEEVFDLRLKLEPEILAIGGERAKNTDVAAVARLLTSFERAVERKDGRAGRLNWAFHLALARPAGLGVTSEIIARLLMLSERYVRFHLGPSSGQAHAIDDHRALFDAWSQGRPALIRRLAARHILRTLRDLRDHL